MAKGKKKSGPQPGVMGQLKRMQGELLKARQELANETVEVTAGGAAVRVVMTGTQECRSVWISPDLVEEGDAEMIQDLVLLAVNQAIHESQVLAARRLGPASNLSGLPGLDG